MDSVMENQTTAAFSKLIAQEKQRERRIARPDLPALKTGTIGILPGDGIGPRLITQAVRILKALMAPELASGQLKLEKIPGCTLEQRLAAGAAIPPEVLTQIEQYPVLLKGPMATPKASDGQQNLESANAMLRRSLDLYTSMRPMALANGNEWTFFRENIEGAYLLGSQGLQVDDDLAIDFVVLTTKEAQRIARKAFQYAADHGKTDVAVVTKANIVKLTDGNFLKADRKSVV